LCFLKSEGGKEFLPLALSGFLKENGLYAFEERKEFPRNA